MCRHTHIVIHAEGSDARHVLEGVLCPCLPEVKCAYCGETLAELGDLRELPASCGKAQHVYPAWQEA